MPVAASTVVLIPGLACDAELLAPQAQALRAAGHAVHDSLVHFQALTLPAMAERLRDEVPGPLVLVGASMGGTTFVIEPYIRFAGQVGEQATMFFRDPAGNALEFKSFRDRSQLFAK